MKVVVTGATGSIGTSVVRALGDDDRVSAVLGVARRPSKWTAPKFDLITADVSQNRLDAEMAGADAVVHLAWRFQPTRDTVATWRTNVLGTTKVLRAVTCNEVPKLVVSSSVGAYSPGSRDVPVPETWPTHGWPGATYTREKAYVERMLDIFEKDNPRTQVVRMRPSFVFQHASAAQQRRLFAGPLLQGMLMQPRLLPFVPDIAGLRFQAIHADDLGEAFRLATLSETASGAYNVAADPVVDADLLADVLGSKTLPVPTGAARGIVAAAWRTRLIPASPGLFDAVRRMPLMDTTRVRSELGWTPRHTAVEAIEEFVRGLRDGDGGPTPETPDEPATGVDRRP